MLFTSLAVLYSNTVPFMIYARLVLSFRGHRASSGGLYVTVEEPGTQVHMATRVRRVVLRPVVESTSCRG